MKEEFKTKCAICGAEPMSLASHLSSNKNPHKMDSEDYYCEHVLESDEERKRERYCKVCLEECDDISKLKPIQYKGLNKGYIENKYCRKHRNLSPKSKKIRSATYAKKKEQKLVNEGYYDLPEFCEICSKNGEDVRFESRAGLARHIWQKHPEVKLEDYYDEYIDSTNHICSRGGCNNKCGFDSLNSGYYKYCSKNCATSDRDTSYLNSESSILKRSEARRGTKYKK